ncbi:MAG: amino acid adenylation domain-containing protein [Pseudomonadota bacterium]
MAGPAAAGDLAGQLAAIWAAVLGYDQLGPEDDFFALGGDSITGMQVVNRIVEELSLPATLALLFEHPTLADLAAALGQAGPAAAAIAPAPERDFYPVAWEQLAVLRAESVAEMGTAFNLPNLLTLPADVDQARLEAALTELVARHEILRTRFTRDGDEFAMQILPPAPVRLAELRLPGGEAAYAAAQARVRPFDLFSAPPLRLELLALADGRRWLLLDIHHSLADGLSVELLAADLAALYAGQAGPPPRLGLKDYAWHSRAGAGEEKLAADRAYWLQRFEGELPRLDLPADRPRPARHTWRGDTVSFALPPGLLADLRAFAAARKVTTFAVVLAAWAALIHRLAASQDVVIAVPVDARDQAGLAGVPGMLVSLLPLRLRVAGNETAAALVAQAQALHAEALGHRAYNLGQLLADLAPPAAPERTLLSEVSLSYMNFAEAQAEADPGGAWRIGGVTRDSCKSDLGIFIRDTPGNLLVALEYYADLFDRRRMERLGGQFQRLLAGLVADPAARVDRLALIDPAERAQLEAWGRGAEPDAPLDKGLYDLLAQAAAARPDDVAVEQAGRSLTYAGLADQARAVAAGLLAAGLRPGDFVAVHLERGCEAVAVLAGILAAGGAYAPLDPAYPAERNRLILADAGCALVVADAPGRQALGDAPGAAVLAAEDLAAGPAAAVELPRVDGAWPAYIMYTSGSTGRPKGVVVPQRAVTRLVLGDDYLQLGPQDRLLQAGPLAFDASTFEIWGALLNGGRLYAASRDQVLDPAALAGLIEDWRPTLAWLTAGLFNRQVEHDAGSLAGMRALITGGEAMSPGHARRFLAACPRTALFNGYGPTENTTFTAVHRVRATDLDQGGAPIGRPVPHTRVRILEPGGEPAPLGVWGGVFAGGLGLADGYWQRPELTAEKFAPDPAGGGRLYDTGDLGRWRDDGVIEFGGRRDNQVKLRGLRIELEEIERTLAAHPAVGRAVALLQAQAGQDPEIIAALTPAAEGVAFDAQALRRWLGRQLPAYMVPARMSAVAAIPVTAHGKVDRPALLACMARSEAAGGDVAGQAPLTPAERLVAAVFSEVFGRPVTDCRLGFLDLGGHSLLAIKVVNRLAERSGVRLSMADFYAAARLSELARRLEGALPPAVPAIPAAPPADLYPASHSQQRLYLLHHMEGGSGAYNMAFAFICDGSLDPEALAQALSALAARHEPLRTGFVERDGEIFQRVAPAQPVALALEDLRGRPEAWDEALRQARREVTQAFDLARPPLLRARVLRLSEDEAVVLLVLHHIVGDGWSSRIFVAELGALYQAARGGAPAGLKPLPLAYKDFAVWQRGQEWGEAAAFWRQRLAGAPERVALVGDRPPPAVQSFRGATCRQLIPAAVMDGLRALARGRGVGLSAVGLAIFAALVYRLTRQADLVLGMGSAGRDRAELEGLVGFFVNVLPVRLRLDETTELEALIDQAHAAMMEALERRDYPFDRLVRDVAPRRQGNRQPLTNVVFEYQNFGRLAADGPSLPMKAGNPEWQAALQALIDSPTAKHDLLLFFIDEPGRAELHLEYDTDILDAATAERWLGYYARFAERAAAAALATARDASQGDAAQ